MEKQITVILRQPGGILKGLQTAGELSAGSGRTRIVFLCPGCASRRECVVPANGPDQRCTECFTDSLRSCAPAGFRYADTGYLAKLIRESDIVIPL